jgi:hypothetical protein
VVQATLRPNTYLIIIIIIIIIINFMQGWAEIAQSVWRIATGWMVRGSNSGGEGGGGRGFPHPASQALGAPQPPIQWVPGHFPGGKAAGAWR